MVYKFYHYQKEFFSFFRKDKISKSENNIRGKRLLNRGMDDMLKSLGALVGVVIARSSVPISYQCIKCNRSYQHHEAKNLAYLCEADRCHGYLINEERL